MKKIRASYLSIHEKVVEVSDEMAEIILAEDSWFYVSDADKERYHAWHREVLGDNAHEPQFILIE